jgi:hypothetical protein
MSESILNHPSVWPNFLPGQPVARRAPEGDTLTKLCDHVSDHVSLGSSSIMSTPSNLTELLESQELPKRTPASVAWEALSHCRDLAPSVFQLCSDFNRYLDMCENTGFKAVGYNPRGNNNGMKVVTGPLLNRWHARRRTAWIARLHELTQWYLVTRPGCTMISLTGYQDGFSIYQTWDSINSSREKLLKIINKYLGKVDYLWVVEPHTEKGTGYPHYHLVVFSDVSIEMEDKLRNLYSEVWKTGSHTYGLDFKRLSENEGIKNLKNYLMKYISKGYLTQAGWSKGELIFNAHLWGASHGYYNDKLEKSETCERKIYRLIGMSRALSKMLQPEREEENNIIWLKVDETEPKEYKNEKGEMIEDLDCKRLYDRSPNNDGIGSIIPDWLLPFRLLKQREDWQERIVDEKTRLREARRLSELRDMRWSD